jgi:SAM-dependent methyltransferase
MQWYEKLFQNFATSYDKQPFVAGTMGEADFIESEIGKDKSRSILDVGCGTGRHSIELAKRGYRVTGIDLSEAQLAKAVYKAKDAGVEAEFIRADARNFSFERKFGLAIMICEGAFPLMETDEMNFEILKCCANALDEKGKFIFTTLNGLFPLFHSVKDLVNSGSEGFRDNDNQFDLMTFRDKSVFDFTDDDGLSHTLEATERYYVPSEITWLLKSLGFKKIDIYAAKLGEFAREHKLSTEDYEMLVIAEK